VQSIPLQAEYCVTSRRNDSLGSRGRWRIFAALCAVSLGLALVFATVGAWPILPYSVLEMAVLFAAFWCIGRHAGDWERLRVDGDSIIVERECAGIVTRHEFNRCWTRLESERGASGTALRLALCSAGKRVAIGGELTPPQRARLARELRRALAAR
jgi:uncharacterized membrane protein